MVPRLLKDSQLMLAEFNGYTMEVCCFPHVSMSCQQNFSGKHPEFGLFGKFLDGLTMFYPWNPLDLGGKTSDARPFRPFGHWIRRSLTPSSIGCGLVVLPLNSCLMSFGAVRDA